MINKIIYCFKNKEFWLQVKRKLYKLYCLIFIHKIDNNKIVFDNFCGKGIGDNALYIVDELIDRNKNVDIVWLVENENVEVKKGIRKVLLKSNEAIYEKWTAKIWVDNDRNAFIVKKRKGQIYFQTWHASFGPKKIEKQIENKLTKRQVKLSKYDGSITDYILVGSKQQERQFKESFWLNKNVNYLNIGTPKDDFLYEKSKDKNNILSLRKKYGFKEDDFIILYAPTWRKINNDETIEINKEYQIDLNKVLEYFNKKYNGKSKMIIRLHPHLSDKKIIDIDENIFNATNIKNGQEISLISDLLITDYSSIITDFIILKKIILLYAPDIKEYKEKYDLLDEYFEWPFDILKNKEDLKNKILYFDKEKYYDRFNKYFEKNQIFVGNNPKKIIVDLILKHMNIN